jgi:glycine/D-amino acid oxidase-like deaminating enzyme
MPDATDRPTSTIDRSDPAAATSYWLAGATPAPEPTLRGDARADVVIVGGGFTGLWTAIRLTETDPSLDVVLLEQAYVGFGASGRNGGFCEASLTHGRANGERHHPGEADLLERLGRDNLRELVAFTREHGIDCDLEETGTLTVADHAHQVDEFRALVDEDQARDAGSRDGLVFLDREAVQAEVHSPLWQAGVLAGPEHNVLIDPAKLCRGLKRVALERGVRIHEATRVTGIERVAGGVRVRTAAWSAERDEPFSVARRLGLPFDPADLLGRSATDRGPANVVGASAAGSRAGSVLAGHVVIATSAYSGWYPRLGALFVPVYDYVLVSDPLSAEQRAAIGWHGRQGMSDANNQFHYFRQTADDRILWGGYDAVYHSGNGVGPGLDRRPQTFAVLERHFRAAFPQLADLGFPYRWGGAIDTTSRFTVTFGQTMGGRVTYALGYTGLGVGASRWAGGVVRDFILRPDSDLLRLDFVRSAPLPFPPEPFRTVAVNVVRRELDRADRNEGRRGLVLRTLDALGIGFDS